MPSDVVILPAGTRRPWVQSQKVFVGNRSPSSRYELCRGGRAATDPARASIPKAAEPDLDTIFEPKALPTAAWRA